ncbi:unnamed protein product [Symbiodinium sp. CCMP2592]|nr:unnamed protein product [Symbiodinium sp. CCMP2592]
MKECQGLHKVNGISVATAPQAAYCALSPTLRSLLVLLAYHLAGGAVSFTHVEISIFIELHHGTHFPAGIAHSVPRAEGLAAFADVPDGLAAVVSSHDEVSIFVDARDVPAGVVGVGYIVTDAECLASVGHGCDYWNLGFHLARSWLHLRK